jgi:hypothetical protein
MEEESAPENQLAPPPPPHPPCGHPLPRGERGRNREVISDAFLTMCLVSVSSPGWVYLPMQKRLKTRSRMSSV